MTAFTFTYTPRPWEANWPSSTVLKVPYTTRNQQQRQRTGVIDNLTGIYHATTTLHYVKQTYGFDAQAEWAPIRAAGVARVLVIEKLTLYLADLSLVTLVSDSSEDKRTSMAIPKAQMLKFSRDPGHAIIMPAQNGSPCAECGRSPVPGAEGIAEDRWTVEGTKRWVCLPCLVAIRTRLGI